MYSEGPDRAGRSGIDGNDSILDLLLLRLPSTDDEETLGYRYVLIGASSAARLEHPIHNELQASCRVQSCGVPVSRPLISTPKGILDNIDRSGGLNSRPLNPSWYPGKYSYPKSAFNW